MLHLHHSSGPLALIGSSSRFSVVDFGKRLFVTVGILPLLLVISFVTLGLVERRFWLPENIFNVFRQSSYLCVISMAQMLVLLTGNFDLSVGANIALGAIVMNLVTVSILNTYAVAPTIAIIAEVAAALATGTVIGVVNGIGVAMMKVHSFIMTLGIMSVALGLALFLSGGMPVSGVPDGFGQVLPIAGRWVFPRRSWQPSRYLSCSMCCWTGRASAGICMR